jgi:hypothetical protein
MSRAQRNVVESTFSRAGMRETELQFRFGLSSSPRPNRQTPLSEPDARVKLSIAERHGAQKKASPALIAAGRRL